MLEGLSADPCFHSRAHRLDLSDDTGYVITRSIIDSRCLCTTPMTSPLQSDGHHLCLHHGLACDVERLLEEIFLDRDLQDQGWSIHGEYAEAPSAERLIQRPDQLTDPLLDGIDAGQPGLILDELAPPGIIAHAG